MTYDPEKLRQILLEGSDDEKSLDVEEKPEEKSAPVESTDKPDVPAPEEKISGQETPSLEPEPEPPPEPEPDPVPERVTPQYKYTKEAVIESIETAEPEETAKDEIPQVPDVVPDVEPEPEPVSAARPVEPDISEEPKPVPPPVDDKPRAEAVPPDPKPVSAPEPPRDSLEPPDELEKVPVDNFSPLRDAILKKSGDESAAHKEIPPVESESVRKKAAEIFSPRHGADESDDQPDEEPDYKLKARKKKKTTSGADKVNPPSPISVLMLFGGMISLAGATVALSLGHSGTPIVGAGSIGIVLVLAFVIMNRRWMKLVLSSRSVKYSANVAIVIISLFGILVFANILAYRYHWRIDMSSDGLHSLSQQTISVLDDVNRAGEQITVIAFTQPDSGYRGRIEDLMDLYIYNSSRLDFRFVDPDVERELAESKGITRNPSILFELGDNKSIVSDVDEPHFTSALLAVRQTHSRLVSFLTGHGEKDPFTDTHDQAGLSDFKDQLELEGYEVNSLRIPEANGVPQETSLLVIASPERDLEDQELDAIGEYLDNAGSIMCFLEPGKAAGLESLLASYGIAVGEGLVLDDENNSYGELMSPVAVGNPEHPITAQFFEDGLVFLNAGNIEYTTSGRLADVAIDSLVRSQSSSWVETTDFMEFDEGVDTRESYEMAVLATRKLETVEPLIEEAPAEEAVESESGNGTSEDTESIESESSASIRVAQVLVVSDGSFILNANFDRYYNRDFAMNAVNFLARQHDLISIRPSLATTRPLDLTNPQKNMIFFLSVILTPLFIAGIGGMVWWRRR